MIKIAEWKANDWIKGQSAQPNLPIGGLFRSISNWDPFEQAGVVVPGLTPDNQVLGTTPKFLNTYNAAGEDFILAHSPTKLYKILKSSPYTVTDVTSEIYGAGGNPDKILGSTIWKGKYIYAFHGDAPGNFIRSNTLPVSAGSDVLIKALSLNDPNVDFVAMCQGPDGNLYTGNYLSINEITSATGTSGNSSEFYIDDGYTVRDITHDGKYLVILADNNTPAIASRRVGAYKVKIYFWDMVQTDGSGRIVPVTIWDIEDSYGIAAILFDGAIYVFTHNGISICNVASQPKQIRPFPADDVEQERMVRPLYPTQVIVQNGSIYWIDGVNPQNTDIYAYGNPTAGQQKIFYRPYTTGITHLATSILWVGNNLVLATDEPALNFFNTGTDRGVASIETLITEVGLHSYGFTKVVLESKLQAGQFVNVTVYSNGLNSTLSSETKVYDASNPRQTLVFKRIPAVNSPDKFTDFTVVVRVGGAKLSRVTTYATPLDDTNEEI